MYESIRPLARTQALLTERLDDELLIYDEERHVGSRLNRTAELVWRSADGARSVAELADALRSEGVEEADEDLVLVALDRLLECGLIESGFEARSGDEARLSRRRFIRRVGVVGTAAMALPVVQSVLAPAAAAAASGGARAEGACYCPCVCGCAGFQSCGTCACESCGYQAASCLSCESCSGCDCPTPYQTACSTCRCGSECGYCDACRTCNGYVCSPCSGCDTCFWICASCYCQAP